MRLKVLWSLSYHTQSKESFNILDVLVFIFRIVLITMTWLVFYILLIYTACCMVTHGNHKCCFAFLMVIVRIKIKPVLSKHKQKVDEKVIQKCGRNHVMI